jgi:hypothetical protein
MNILHNKYHIIRNGDFATNGNTKVLYGIFSGILCMDDYFSKESTDCISIMIGSSIIWTVVEMYLHATRTRIIKPMQVGLAGRQLMLPQSVGALLQGVQEGGVVTTVGLYYGDRIHDAGSMIHLHLFIVVVIANVLMRDTITDSMSVKSLRQVNTWGSGLLILATTTYNLSMVWRNPEHASRQLAMLSIMVYICSYWTFFSWCKGHRTIEVHVRTPTHESNSLQKYSIKPVTALDTFFILAYDVLFEVGIAYVLFYNLFVLSGV